MSYSSHFDYEQDMARLREAHEDQLCKEDHEFELRRHEPAIGVPARWDDGAEGEPQEDDDRG